MGRKAGADTRSAEDKLARPLGGPAGACGVCGCGRVWKLCLSAKHGAKARCGGCEAEQEKIYKKANPEKNREKEANRRARLAGAVCGCGCEGRGYGSLWVGRTCYVCKKAPAEATDHVQPIAQGGLHCSRLNMKPACLSCNSAKGDRVYPGSPDWPAFILQRRAQASEVAAGGDFCPEEAQVPLGGVLTEDTQFRWTEEPMTL